MSDACIEYVTGQLIDYIRRTKALLFSLPRLMLEWYRGEAQGILRYYQFLDVRTKKIPPATG